MKLYLNGKLTDVRAGTLEELLRDAGFGTARVATAVNEAFVAASRRSACELKEGDRVEVVAPIQGG